jgi:hypothetical protein
LIVAMPEEEVRRRVFLPRRPSPSGGSSIFI